MSPGNPQSVVVDGETVVFEGPPPSDLKQLYSLIDQALTGGGRLIRAFEVDGIDAHQDISCLDRPSYTRVDVQSIAWEEACANTLQPMIKNAAEAADALIAYGSAMLAIPLAQTVKEVGTVADKMGAIVSPFETAGQFAGQFNPSWKTESQILLEQCNAACEIFTQSLQAQDVGCAAEALVISLPDALISLKNLESAPWSATVS